MNRTISQRINALRALLKEKGIDAFIIPSTDPHLSEYVAPHWQSREWISGFTGSAGTVVVTSKKAGLWTDSRYFLQAALQLEGSGIDLYKEMLPETPTISEFLKTNLASRMTVGIDGKVFSTEEVIKLKSGLEKNGIIVKCISDPMNSIWTERPAMPEAPAFIYETKYAGRNSTEKLTDIRKEMKRNGAEALLVSALDEIAWTLNIRGTDVHCNPVTVSYLLLTEQEVHFFIQPLKVTNELAAYLKETGIEIHSYEDIESFLGNLSTDNILLNPAKTNYAVYSAIRPNCRIIEGVSPIAFLKAIRNQQEIAGIHTAMQRDGIALVKFLKWLENAVPTGKETEISIDKKLHGFRAEQPLYMGESFDTIAGYKEHGAIVHYEATPETDVPVLPKGFLLLDSGAQYMDGTTDITRTIALGELTEEEKEDYTLILKGHIALATAVFPAGTRGAQLDVLARMPIWKHRMNFLHGTGHGVGHFLNVHEGPQSIRMNENPVTLQPGMVTSNEPGVYKTGSHGIRTENLVLTVPAGEGMFGNYLKFETITLCPICKKGIIKEMLTTEETEWLDQYHQKVYEKLSPGLNKEEQEWLKEACKSLTSNH
ncbi:aminopeptidase P family protein [Bacteroides helcogenes]|uniref:Creatinase n=1 Tax=Bacteroides helcogenes (strain ATCC 35417 / DSM 20613 / JCM 6297 / CCUG 15421 / P 36-108) TaxID=693979 RepID=E6SRA4_BACT6|nr:aminopeptidase P family protein [Bacteroides helcogenes]ADV43048.1 creatinase [Bacteroides helcogenes P 36-108]MDY5236909.1 aminopeptidase P family protein [Bacteroides helcogenes]